MKRKLSLNVLFIEIDSDGSGTVDFDGEREKHDLCLQNVNLISCFSSFLREHSRQQNLWR